MFASVNRTLPKDLTSYDFLKMAAVLLMVVDHIGFFFFDDVEAFRIIGRACVPIWFFLVGYANSRNLSLSLWIGMGLLVASSIVSGMYIFPLNILATILIVRVILNPLMDRALRDIRLFWAVSVFLFFVALPFMMMVEYGAEGLLISMLGYLLRRREEIEAKYPKLIERFLIYALTVFLIFEYVAFGFTQAEMGFLVAASLVSFGAILIFKPKTYPGLSSSLPWGVPAVIRFFGRHTLAIYVIHLIAFKGLGMWLEPERFQPFNWSWFPVL